jgi:hypothetical protein
MDPRSFTKLAIAGSCAVLLTACASYYQVRDPASGATYYTSDIDKPGGSGTVRFKDDRTRQQVTLQNSQVREISRDEYERGLAMPPPRTVIIR